MYPRSLGWRTGEVREYVERLQAAPWPTAKQLGLMAAVAHRIDPGVALDRALDAEDPALRVCALEAAGRLGMRDLQPRLRAAFESEDATCRFWAAWSAVRLGDRAGISVLGGFAGKGGSLAKPACDLALRVLDPDHAIRAHARLMSMTGDKRLGVLATGIIGDPSLVGWLLDAMESPSLARLAGAAFCLMTGRDLRRDDLDSERPATALAPKVLQTDPSDNDGKVGQESRDQSVDSLADDEDEEFAWPDTTRLRRWWDEHRHDFVPGRRYLAGLPIRSSELTTVLRTGNQQQRASAALELALLYPEAPLQDVTAPAHRQITESDHLSE